MRADTAFSDEAFEQHHEIGIPWILQRDGELWVTRLRVSSLDPGDADPSIVLIRARTPERAHGEREEERGHGFGCSWWTANGGSDGGTKLA